MHGRECDRGEIDGISKVCRSLRWGMRMYKRYASVVGMSLRLEGYAVSMRYLARGNPGS
jgi:hypothetical protein